ncbi:MAG: MFS transporter [Actinobacteria bacterium]|nr:MFS transporter [Actinomycetota bacterium]
MNERKLLLVAITLTGFLGAFVVSSTNIALPMIQKDFQLSAIALSWIPLAYVLTTAAMLMPSGRVADLFGHKRVYLWSSRVFALLLLVTALVPSAGILVALRAAQGIPAALSITSSTALIAFVFPKEERGKAFGLFAAGPYIGLTLGPVVGGLVLHATGWKILFLVAGGLGVINCLIPVWRNRGLDWREATRGRFDWLGAAVYALALPALLLGLTLIPGWLGISLVVAGLLGVALFVRSESRVSDPLFDVALFRRNRLFAFSNLAAFVNYAATLATTFLLSLYLQFTRGLDARTAGLILFAGAFFQAVFSPVAGRLVDRVRAHSVASAGMALCVAALVAFVFLGQTTSYVYIVVVLSALGLGFALFASPITYVVMGSVDGRHVGLASSTLASFRWAGQNFSLGIAGLMLALVVGSRTLEPALYPRVLSSVRISFAIFAGLCLAGEVVLVLGSHSVQRPAITSQ